MPFKKGQSGNPSGRRKGSVSKKVALKNLLEQILSENVEEAQKMLLAMFDSVKDFKWLCDLKAQFEVKELGGNQEQNFTNININIVGTNDSKPEFEVLRSAERSVVNN